METNTESLDPKKRKVIELLDDSEDDDDEPKFISSKSSSSTSSSSMLKLNPREISIVFQTKEELQMAILDYLNKNENHYPNIGEWDVSAIKDMSGLFMNLITSDEKNDKMQNIGKWNITNVENMESMFEGCTYFNQPLQWRTLNVVNVKRMFAECQRLNQEIYLVTDNIKSSQNMFLDCSIPYSKLSFNLQKIYLHNIIFESSIPFENLPEDVKYDLTMFPQSKRTKGTSQRMVPSFFIVGNNLPNGISTANLQIESPDLKPLFRAIVRFKANAEKNYPQEHYLMEQYMVTQNFCSAIECFVGNRLTTFFLTMYPETKIIDNPLQNEVFSIENPVILSNRYMSYKKIRSILIGFRKLNNFLKSFPLLGSVQNESHQPLYEHLFIYRGKEYQNEIERLTVGQTFVLPKITSTTVDIEHSKYFTRQVLVKYMQPAVDDKPSEVVTNYLGFFWRIKMPKDFPCALINFSEYEICLPLGTVLRYLGSHVELPGETSIYETEDEKTKNNLGDIIGVKGALICDFEIMGFTPEPIRLEPIIRVIDEFAEREKFQTNSFPLLVQNVIPDSSPINHVFNYETVLPEDVFGGSRKRRNKKRKFYNQSRRQRQRRQTKHRKQQKQKRKTQRRRIR